PLVSVQSVFSSLAPPAPSHTYTLSLHDALPIFPLVSMAPRKLELPQGHSNAPSENIFHGVADVEVPETSTGQMGPGTNNWDAYQAIGVACAHNRKGDGAQATTGQGLDALGDPRPDGILPIAIAEKQDGPCMGLLLHALPCLLRILVSIFHGATGSVQALKVGLIDHPGQPHLLQSDPASPPSPLDPLKHILFSNKPTHAEHPVEGPVKGRVLCSHPG